MRGFVKVIISFIVVISSFSMQARAEVGNKPTLKIIVKNPPQGEYYLDLLVDYTTYNSYTWFEPTDRYDEDKLNILKGYSSGKWRSATLTGTKEQLTGELIGRPEGDTVVHEFSNSGIPEKFKIVVLTKDNKMVTSQQINTKAFKESVEYDFKSGEVKQTSIVLSYTKQFVSTVIVSLLLEGIFLVVFGFNLMSNLKVFLLINLFTQIIINIALSIFIGGFGMLGVSIFYIPVQLIIFVFEVLLFLKLLRPKNKGKIVSYTIVANIVNYISIYLLLDKVFFVPFIK